MLGRLTLAGVGSMSSATDFAVNANHATTASTATADPIAIVMRLGPRRSATLLAAPGLNAIGVIATSDVRRAIARELIEIRRRRIAGRDDPLDAQRERAVAGHSALEPRTVERDDVAVLELARARQRLAADAQIAGPAAGLNEERVLEAADLDAARDALERDVGIVTGAERNGQLGGAEFVPPPSLLDRHDRISPAV